MPTSLPGSPCSDNTPPVTRSLGLASDAKAAPPVPSEGPVRLLGPLCAMSKGVAGLRFRFHAKENSGAAGQRVPLCARGGRDLPATPLGNIPARFGRRSKGRIPRGAGQLGNRATLAFGLRRARYAPEAAVDGLLAPRSTAAGA